MDARSSIKSRLFIVLVVLESKGELFWIWRACDEICVMAPKVGAPGVSYHADSRAARNVHPRAHKVSYFLGFHERERERERPKCSVAMVALSSTKRGDREEYGGVGRRIDAGEVW